MVTDSPVRYGLLFGLVLLVYWPVFHAGYVWDDKVVYENPLITSSDGLRDMWLHPTEMRPYEIHYWPMTHSTFWIEHQLWGNDPVGYHIVNVVLHALNSIVLWIVLIQIGIRGAWLAAYIFALHPVHAESVCWIVERKDLLSGLFYLLAMSTFIKYYRTRKTSHMIATMVLYPLALLSKSIVITFPVALIIYIWWQEKQPDWKKHGYIIVVAVFSLGYAIFDVILSRGGEVLTFHFTAIEKILIAGRAMGFYLFKLIWPFPLMAVYPLWIIDSSDLWQYLFPITFVIGIALLWIYRNRLGKAPFAAMIYFAVTLGPVLGFIEFGYMRYSFVADRFQYLASIGPIMLAAAGIHYLFVRQSQRIMLIKYGVIVVLMIVYSYLTLFQAGTYQGKMTLFQHNVNVNPDAYIAHYNLAAQAVQGSDYETALTHYREVERIKPEHGDSMMQLGNTLMALKRWKEAEAAYSRDLKNRPDRVNSWINRGNCLLRQGMSEDAIESYRSALAFDRENPLANNNLGFCLFQKGDYAGAIEHYTISLKTNPNSLETHINMGRAYTQQNEPTNASKHCRAALAIDPGNIEAMNNLSWFLSSAPHENERNPAEAVRLAEKACSLTGHQDPGCLDTLAAAYASKGDFVRARAAASEALELAKNSTDQELVNEISQKLKQYQSKNINH